MPNAAAEKQKSIGNDFFRRGQYREAIAQYEKAAAIDRTNAAYHSNIAASYEKLKMWKESADAASNCIKTNKTFLKGYFRLATAQQALKDHAGAQKTLEEGLVYDANNKDLKKMKADLVEKQRHSWLSTNASGGHAWGGLSVVPNVATSINIPRVYCRNE